MPFIKDFTINVVEGYETPPPAKTFIVTNTGTTYITGLTVELKQDQIAGRYAFQISEALSNTSLAPGETATVSVRPAARVEIGSTALHPYRCVLQIAGDNDVRCEAAMRFHVEEKDGSFSCGLNSSVGTPMTMALILLLLAATRHGRGRGRSTP
jgi:hypothetical protein